MKSTTEVACPTIFDAAIPIPDAGTIWLLSASLVIFALVAIFCRETDYYSDNQPAAFLEGEAESD